MSSEITSSSTPQQTGTPQPAGLDSVASRCEGVIDDRLGRTRRHVKSVDIADGAITLAVGVLAFLLAVAALDHWLIAGGLGFWGRLLLWVGLVGGSVAYFVYRLLPPLLHRVNPIFAAATIEKSEPSLKNSLINFLLLRGHRQDVAPSVLQAMEQRAAVDLDRVPVDSVVDRAHVIRMGCVLLALVAVFCVYVVVSPKNPLRSAARVLWPWSQIDPPTRVRIRDVQPGNASAFYGESIAVSAEVVGIKADEPVLLVYSTADGQSVDQEIPMKQANGELRHQCRFPPGQLVLQQDYEYRLVAGDAKTHRFKIRVRIAPAVTIDRVEYHYPAYTGIADQTIEGQGDLRAIEGTKATLHATANTEIKQGSAEIDLDCTGRRGVNMKVDGSAAVGQFTLRLKPDDRSRPEHECYQVRFADLQGQENRRPVRHRIDVVRDLPPEVQIVEPREPETQVAPNGRVLIRLRANDPDFALRRAILWAEIEGKPTPIHPFLDRKSTEKPWLGEFLGEFPLEPSKLGLKAGDRVPFWGEAEDNKEPEAGHSITEKQWIVVVAESPGQAKDDADRDQGKRPTLARRSGAPSKEDRADDAAGREQPPQEKNANSDAAKASPENKTNDEKQNAGDKQPGNDKQSSDNKQSSGEQPSPDKKSADEPSPSENQQTPDQKTPDQKTQDSQSKDSQASKDAGKGADGQSGDKNQGDSNSGDGKSGDQGSGDKNASDEKSAGNKSGDKNSQQPSDQPSGENSKTGGQAGGSQGTQPSEKTSERIDPDTDPGGAIQEILNDRQEKQQNQQPADNEKTGDKQSGDQPSGNEKAGTEKAGTEKAGTEKPDTEQADEQKSDDGKAENGKTENQKAGTEKPGKEQTGKEKADSEETGNEQAGNEKAGNKKDGKGKGGNQETDSSKDGKEKGGNEKAGNEKAGDETTDGKKPGDEKTAPEPSSDAAEGVRQPDEDMSKGEKSGSAEGGKQQPQPTDQKQKSPTEPEQRKPSSGQKPNGMKPADPDTPADSSTDSSAQTPDAQGKSTEQPTTEGQPSTAKQTGDTPQPGKQPDGKSGDKQPSGEQTGEGQGESTESDKDMPASNAAKDPGDQSESSAPEDKGSASDKPPASPKDKDQQGKGQQGKGSEPSQSEGKPSSETADKQPDMPGGDGKGPSQEDAKSSGGTKASKSGATPNGGTPNGQPDAQAANAPESPADPANLSYAQKQTELALEHLRDQLAKEKPGLLERLGWTRDDARRFLDRWEQMRRSAAIPGTDGEAARKELDNTLRSLGLRPRAAQLSHGDIAPDQRQNLRDAGRFAPPPEWAEQFREYTRGVAGAEKPTREDHSGADRKADK